MFTITKNNSPLRVDNHPVRYSTFKKAAKAARLVAMRDRTCVTVRRA